MAAGLTVSYPDAHHLQALIVAFLGADGLMSGYESAEGEAMWAAVLREAPRMRRHSTRRGGPPC
ncbi:MAG: hypothetical protein E6I52_22540 [Chloroflexi bacterium]|nr:MAG: hypothetical protein E6I52_22540 [Chloroflexota bacterium]